MKIIPLNTDTDGNAFSIRAQYFKMGWINFTRNWGGQWGFVATGIIEFYEDD